MTSGRFYRLPDATPTPNWRVRRTPPNGEGGKNRDAAIGMRVPDVFGRRVVWPDRLVPKWDFYNGLTAEVSWLMVLGRGHYVVHDRLVDWVRLAPNPSASVPDVSSYVIHPPGTAIPALAATGYAHDYPRVAFDGELYLDGALSDWFPVDMRWSSRLVFDIEFPDGLFLRKDDAVLSHSVDFEYYVRQTLPGGGNGAALGPYSFTLSNASGSDAKLRFTKVHDLGAANAGGEWQLQLRVTSAPNTTEYAEAATLVRTAALIGIPALEPALFPDVTVARGVVSTSADAASSRDPAWQADVTRLLQVVTNSGGRASGRTSTRRAIDAMAELAAAHYPAGVFPLAELAAAHLNALQWSTVSCEFNGVLDSEASLEDDLGVLADHAQMTWWRSGAELAVFRDGEPPTSEGIAAVFVPRDMGAELGARTFGFAPPDEPDHVVVRWRDPAKRYAVREAVHPAPGARPLEVDLEGCVYFEQAAIRASYEWEALRRRRDRLTLQVQAEAVALRLWDLVVVHDPFVDGGGDYAGAIVGQVSSVKVTVDRDLPSIPAFSLLYLRTASGAVYARAVVAVVGRDVEFSGGGVSLGQLPQAGEQRGPTFSIYALGLTSKQWRVTGLAEAGDGMVAVELLEDDANVHTGERVKHYDPDPLPYQPIG